MMGTDAVRSRWAGWFIVAATLAALEPVPARAQAAGGRAQTSEAAPDRAGDTGAARPTGAAARDAFARLASLAGEWAGRSTDATSGDTYLDELRVEYRLTGGGSTLMELARAGTPEEMLSVYFLDGERLVLQHYCSAHNRPRMELVRADDAGLEFDLVGGTGFDPATDGHIHAVRFLFRVDGTVESLWTWLDGAAGSHVNRRTVRRVPGR
jgi:hypothetical protein